MRLYFDRVCEGLKLKTWDSVSRTYEGLLYKNLTYLRKVYRMNCVIQNSHDAGTMEDTCKCYWSTPLES
jgi:hypothetical protein